MHGVAVEDWCHLDAGETGSAEQTAKTAWREKLQMFHMSKMGDLRPRTSAEKGAAIMADEEEHSARFQCLIGVAA